jgi:hypothetical protein
MKKAALFFLALAMLAGYSVESSEASQLCWQIEGVGGDQYIKVSVVRPDPAYPHKSLNGMMYETANHTNAPLVGTMVKNHDGTTSHLTLYGTLPIGSNLVTYALDATIDNITKNGTLIVYIEPIGQMSSYSITKVNCATLPAP